MAFPKSGRASAPPPRGRSLASSSGAASTPGGWALACSPGASAPAAWRCPFPAPRLYSTTAETS
ncbi:hypothetical protein ACP70R_030206 [Stipagrostis hirtigluma subsp. patula]